MRFPFFRHHVSEMRRRILTGMRVGELSRWGGSVYVRDTVRAPDQTTERPLAQSIHGQTTP
jgi:hypothetical protein